MIQNKQCQLLLQICRFGIVGIAATLIHVTVFTALVHFNFFQPLVSNIIAFFPAFTLSFHSHYRWTFRCDPNAERSHRIWVLLKFLGVALLGLAFNSLWVYLVVDVFEVEYYYTNLFIVFVTPAILFVLNKLIVFKKK